MRRSADIALGVGTALPLLFSFGAALVALPRLQNSIRELRDVRGPSDFVFGAIIAVVSLTFALVVFYVFHVARNPQVPAHDKAKWIAAIVFFSAAGMLAYWYVFFWRRTRLVESTSSEPAAPT